MTKKWSASAYAFFQPIPAIEYRCGRKCHVFACAVKGCKHVIARYLDTTDRESTGNMRKHVRSCWGPDILDIADQVENLEGARKVVKAHQNNGTITTMFEHLKGKGAVTYLHRAHTKTETCYYLPHPTTISRDVKTIFAKTWQRIAKLLQEYDGDLSFATDAWTLPNHQAFVAFTVHFIHNGQPVRMLLDFVEVSKVFHTYL
ncbi:hypothetical protein ARMSODRAFT_989723 [Armillaria solidipes]|uniref:BED-type domain-containing protein n=1 Tax=Armillaria solidipes TaxID=1076256 RepID=A0A2H3B3L2_9AGAR|nr:hypothetical protein ARMSODRAFT_989723 [Armillaria solidipes]